MDDDEEFGQYDFFENQVIEALKKSIAKIYEDKNAFPIYMPYFAEKFIDHWQWQMSTKPLDLSLPDYYKVMGV